MLIKEETMKRAILKAMADEQASKILLCTSWRAKSIVEVARECDIPHTSAYRHVNEMKESGLLVVHRIKLTDDGKKYALYRSAFKSIIAKLDGGNIEVEVDVNREVGDKIFRLFYSLGEKEE